MRGLRPRGTADIIVRCNWEPRITGNITWSISTPVKVGKLMGYFEAVLYTGGRVWRDTRARA